MLDETGGLWINIPTGLVNLRYLGVWGVVSTNTFDATNTLFSIEQCI